MNCKERNIYRFGASVRDGVGITRERLGGKGAGLVEMSLLDVPIPPGFTITTDICAHYLKHGRVPTALTSEFAFSLAWLEMEAGKQLNDPDNPLLVSVRSGAPVSMPGMMDTILNVGLNDACVEGLGAMSGSIRFALDSYRRLLQMFGSVVMGIPKDVFWVKLEAARLHESVVSDSDLSEEVLRELIEAFKVAILDGAGMPFPQDPQIQLSLATEAVFKSWQGDRAKFYRKLNNIPDTMGTAVTVQAMVFGNRGQESGTGVGFTRNPSTGEKLIFAEFLSNAQGEDIVAGVRTPVSVLQLAESMPLAYEELHVLTAKLEKYFRDVQDFEFTIEEKKLFLLQTRSAKRAVEAAVRIAVEMVEEGLISEVEALSRIDASSLGEMLSPQLDLTGGQFAALAQGLPASPGAAVGKIAFSSAAAVAMAAAGESVILVTHETTADDIQGMSVCLGFLTARGGATSHAAVVARGMGRCCITGAKAVHINESSQTVEIGGVKFQSGDWLSIEGNTGRVFEGKVPCSLASDKHPHLDKLLRWARAQGKLGVRANADTPEDAQIARRAHAEGIGLCRTEHMFFAADRLQHVRSMILATTLEERVAALEILLPMQQNDFEKLFQIMSPLPVTIRLLDPPLHEFLPSVAEINVQIADARGDEDWDHSNKLEAVRHRVELLTEANPMMGHRGCRLSLTYPEILEMQVSAILQAAIRVSRDGIEVHPEIMVPLVSSEEEMKVLARMIHATAERVFVDEGATSPYAIGTMIELPRAAVCAGPISKHVSFISFGTNDLTQMTYGFSRDDARNYLDSYLEQGIFTTDPFVTVDQAGVGQLIAMAVRSVRETNPNIKIGVCGEHGGDPLSINFFQSLGIDYVSCSTSRLYTAQLAAGQTASGAHKRVPVLL